MSLSKYSNPDYSVEVLGWINSNLSNYLKVNNEDQSEVEHILDYLNSDKAPRRLQRMSYEEAKAGAEKWLKALMKKGNDVVETEADIKTVINFKNGFKLVRLVADAAYKREGALMAHCVASYADKKDSEVYSLRDANNMPHCTMEIVRDQGAVQQIKGKGNGSVHPKYIKYVLECLGYFDIEVKSCDMGNLGYSDLSSYEGLWSFLENNFDGIKFISFGGIKYFYKYSNLVKSS